MEPLIVKGMAIGEGIPKTIVSVMDQDVADAVNTIEKGRSAGIDCFEWRADFSPNLHDAERMVQDGRDIAAALPHNPLLFTFRSTSQGGQCTLPVREYIALNQALIESGCIDLVDIESWIGDAAVADLVDCAKRNGVGTIVSYHNFKGTPSKEWMVSLLVHMQDLGADIPKIAVMAHDAHDVLELLAATEEMSRIHATGPLLTMAMGREGSLSRLTGELFGSALTFCALGTPSAPGQVEVGRANVIMASLHDILA